MTKRGKIYNKVNQKKEKKCKIHTNEANSWIEVLVQEPIWKSTLTIKDNCHWSQLILIPW